MHLEQATFTAVLRTPQTDTIDDMIMFAVFHGIAECR